MGEAAVRIDGRHAPLIVRINGRQPTFRLATDALETKALRELDPVLLDLMEIASTVFAADGAIPRGGRTRPGMGADWYRRFDFEIPVRHPELWQRDDVAAALREAVETLTEDSVSFRFTPAAPDPVPQPYLDLDPAGASFEADEVILFSGGLDSFAGALELLATTSSRVVLVTHRSAQKAIPRQVELGQYLAERFSSRVLHVHVLARRVDQDARDSTQRSRTFLFSALGQAVARAFGAERMSFFENGIVSHNLPLSPQIVSTMATRTTHPLALRNINRLMQLVVPAAAPIENRFKWLTKSEVVARIDEYGASTQIPRAVSCTSIREQNKLQTHCGSCTQCFDRRFAILHAGLAEYDPEETYATDILFGERRSDRSVTMAVEWTRHALRLGDLDEQRFIQTFGHEASRIFRGHPELPRRTALDLTLEMHQRHSTVVRKVLENVLRDKAADLVAQRFPATSLVVLHLSSPDGPVDLVPRYLLKQDARAFMDEVEQVDEFDEVPEAGAPLRVAFFMEGARPVVDVIGLTSVVGPPARVPHALKPAFDEDKRNGTAPDDHQFRIGTTLPDLADMNKRTIRKSVERCRKQLAEEYEQLHGEPPPGHLLIQTQPSRGYRLDPYIVVVPPNRAF
jgi:7-cyano-7-deazaguanine synthase in queuosine biosynthesis